MEMTFVINGPTNQKRRCGTKVRTGCTTCKLRHVKCDEKRPFCDKCVSSGRKCPGYNVFRAIETRISKTGSALTRSPSPLLPDATYQERLHFDTFQNCIIDGFCGIFDGPWWSPYVLKAAVAEPMILHATLAFAASSNTTTSNEEFVFKQHDKAIKAFQVRLQKADDLDPNIALLTTLLLACLGFARDNADEAMLHLHGGAAVLTRIKNIDNVPDKPGPTTAGAECCIIDAFRRLDLATSLSMTSRAFPSWFSQWVAKKGIILDSSQLDNLATLRNRLGRWTTEIVCLMQDVRQHIFGFYGLPLFRDDYPLQVRLQEMAAASEQWLAAFNHFLLNVLPSISYSTEREHAQRAAQLLRIQHLASSIMLMTSLADGRELVYDNHLEDFRAIVDLSAPLVPHYKSQAVSFTLDVGVIPSLYYVACKCRDSTIRHKAIDLLLSSTHREGAWEAQVSARSAAKIVKLEEKAAVKLAPGKQIVTAADIPEVARLYEAYFDVDTGEDLVYCKRRRFEYDGSWLDWEEVVVG